MKCLLRSSTLFIALFFARYAFSAPVGHVLFQAGGVNAFQGEAQHIGINGLIGDRFSVTSRQDQNALFGLGYFIEGANNHRFTLLYGLNAFYLLQTTVKGNVTQENLFRNLSYRYDITNWPIYLATKFIIPLERSYQLTIDFGLGTNIIQTSNFSESSLDGITIPDHIFAGQTNLDFSGSIGAGLLWKTVEIDYRFFYLGKGQLQKQSSQVKNQLTTGNSCANALFISVFLN